MVADHVPSQQELTERVKKSAKWDQMRAALLDTITKVMKEEKSELFEPLPAVKQTIADPDGLAALSLIKDFLDIVGLQHTSNMLSTEAQFQSMQRDGLQKKFGQTPADTPVLMNLVKGGKAAPAAAAAAAAVTKEPLAAAKALAPITAAAVPTAAPVAKPVQAAEPEVVQDPKAKDETYYIAKWKKRTFVRREDKLNGQQLTLDTLHDCKVYVIAACDSMYIDDCVNCEIYVAACEGSIFVRDCTDCKVTAAVKQLRTRDCKNLDMRLFATTDPVVEASSNVRFRPFNMMAPNLKKYFELARLNPAENRYIHVYDFTADDPKYPEPHFVVQHENHGLKMEEMAQGEYGPCEAPPEIKLLLEGKIQPAESSESSNKSMDIKSGSGSWKADVAPSTGQANTKIVPKPFGATPAPKPSAIAPIAPIVPVNPVKTAAPVKAAAPKVNSDSDNSDIAAAMVKDSDDDYSEYSGSDSDGF